MTLTFNPWSAQSWLKGRFFDVIDDNVLALTTTYKCNEWLSETDLKLFEDMKRRNPKRYKVAGEGDWGIADGLVFNNWTVEDLTNEISHFANIYHGLDFGVNDPNALICFDVEMGQRKIYIFDEYYQNHISLDKLSEEVKARVQDRCVYCDSAGSQHILELFNRGIWALPASKGPNSIMHGIQWLQSFDIVVHKDCVNTIKELSEYCWAKDKFDRSIDKPEDKNNHLMDALRYGCEPLYLTSEQSISRRLF
jgi:phage terminase large subunit